MATSLTVDPVRKFEIKGVVSTVLCLPLLVAVGNNTQIIAAVAGKRIRVMGWLIQSAGAVGTILFKSASAGTALTPTLTMPANAAGANDKLPLEETGYFETLTGEGLFADVGTTDQRIMIFYIVYTP